MITLPGKLGKIFSLHTKPIQTQLMLGRWSILETTANIHKRIDMANMDNCHVSNIDKNIIDKNTSNKTYTLHDETLAEIQKRRYYTPVSLAFPTKRV